MKIRVARLVLWGVVIVVMAGCSRFPDPPDKPDLNPSKAGSLAIEEYDANGDGKIDADEIKSSPGLMEALQMTDKDGDGSLTADEISVRVGEWLDGGTVVFTQSTGVSLDGKPLAGATVTYDPEPFLAHAVEPSSGVTDEQGIAFPKGQDAKYPGLYTGVYRVRISKIVDGQQTIPARYNTETILGKEIAADSQSTLDLLVFALESE
jgi:hypothetical protein